jgi:ABC-type lipoprotein export system ATPase subunit
MSNPSLLLLDEPTIALDQASTRKLLEVIASHTKSGAAVVIVTHDPAAFSTLSPRRYKLDQGRLSEVAC